MDKDSSAAAESALSCSRCGKPAYLQCPKCVELKLPREGAAFCYSVCFFLLSSKQLSACSTQDCFKASWSSHKSVHFKSKLANVQSEQTQDGWLYCLRKGQTRTSELPYFDWTGALRPYPISQQRLVPEGLEKPDWAVDGIPKIEPNSDLQNIVEIKTPEQIERMRETCRSYRAELAQALIEPKLGLGWAQLGCTIAREVLDAAARIIRPGITTDEIDEVVHQATIAAGGYPSPLNYHFFPKSCCTSVNEVICHGIPDARKLEDGDIVNVDVTVYYKGVHGDLNETFFVGEVDEASQQLVRCTYECLEKAISIVKPGVRFREVGEVINRHATMSGLSVVKSYCGHGIGELFHCAPNIPHYGSILAGNKAVGIMKAGQTFTIEPMINAGVWRDRLWPDGWTAVTADGKRSAQFEHTLLVTETGVEVLTARLPSSPKVFPWLNS
ncbi:Removes the N-terminal methionine from nascent proteins (By similarity) [Musa troglodytarum]|uniref:Methionine aminopeptidase n=2 Tax=Musa troglodytarum TaxID=320322 RepID=A0A9E7EKM7_9LILI|nr:Removes the N-terminal methionine from nascent proteins (By similarity) [Musa troglodytarum]URD80394.1 Removes the N-terminal methionine from nascent proteins (By similarity) [Musa troglodytarum]